MKELAYLGNALRQDIMDDLPLPQTPWAVGNVAVPQSPTAPTKTPLMLQKA
jgi:hypothetical protein